MDAAMQQQLTIAAVAMSAVALFLSMLAMFPGLKGVLSAVRDGVLWFALFLVAGGLGFVIWQQLQKQSNTTAAVNAHPSGSEPQRSFTFPSLANPNDQHSTPDPRAAVTP
jgi:hypothetical protein